MSPGRRETLRIKPWTSTAFLLSSSTENTSGLQSSRCLETASLFSDQGLRPCQNKLCFYDVLDVSDAYNSCRILCILIAYILDHWLLLLWKHLFCNLSFFFFFGKNCFYRFLKDYGSNKKEMNSYFFCGTKWFLCILKRNDAGNVALTEYKTVFAL